MHTIFVSFSPYIGNILRSKFNSGNLGPIKLDDKLTSLSYWHKRYPDLPKWKLRHKPVIKELMIAALKDADSHPAWDRYRLAINEREFNELSPEEKLNYTPFELPNFLCVNHHMKPTPDNVCMDKANGTAFRQAVICFFYEVFSEFLCAEAKVLGINFKPHTAIKKFCDTYDLSYDDETNLKRQYYRQEKITAYDNI